MRPNFDYTRNVSATIASGAALSNTIDLERYGVSRIYIPSGWTTANLTFQVSEDGLTFSNLLDNAGTEVTLTVTAGTAVAVPSSHVLASGCRLLKIRSGTSATPVNQGSTAVLVVVQRPFN